MHHKQVKEATSCHSDKLEACKQSYEWQEASHKKMRYADEAVVVGVGQAGGGYKGVAKDKRGNKAVVGIILSYRGFKLAFRQAYEASLFSRNEILTVG